ncbi:hypothetical protein M2158_000064 [Streptomyces sp. SAI-144]|uniref:DUF1360 domain-containing protein n=1 Tax=Streptomyces sp. SAI-144 TaxID=2940544 RepID=UPI002475F215|nr:DUF1360 domain-containing protein [Streptomyces sp. SAI-144]MDH6431587.1 hypothetical protein [Streptomyces sp. SAI-144]
MATPTDNRIRRRSRTFLRRTGRGYAGTHDRPLRGYLATMAAFGVYASGWAAAVRLRGRPLPDRPEPWDVLLTSVATFRLSRLLSKAPVTSPLRAPFTTYVGPQGPAELHEEAQPETGKETVAELVTCLLWPRATRTAMGTPAAPAGADALQPAYGALVDRTTDS